MSQHVSQFVHKVTRIITRDAESPHWTPSSVSLNLMTQLYDPLVTYLRLWWHHFYVSGEIVRVWTPSNFVLWVTILSIIQYIRLYAFYLRYIAVFILDNCFLEIFNGVLKSVGSWNRNNTHAPQWVFSLTSCTIFSWHCPQPLHSVVYK
jgi:hypothetical protein